MTKFSRTTPNELSPLWVAMCAAQQTSLQQGELILQAASGASDWFPFTANSFPYVDNIASSWRERFSDRSDYD